MGSLRDALTEIYEQRKELTAPIVVEEASDPTHPLHDRFEWDDSVAGPKYRLQQASALIRQVSIVYREDGEDKRSVRAFTAVRREDDPSRMAYRPTTEVLENELSRKIVLQECKREIDALRRKYEHLTEFADLIAGVHSELAS